METIINIHIEKLPERVYLATSEDLQGLVAQGRTISETLEIARDVAKKLIEVEQEQGEKDGWLSSKSRINCIGQRIVSLTGTGL